VKNQFLGDLCKAVSKCSPASSGFVLEVDETLEKVHLHTPTGLECEVQEGAQKSNGSHFV